MNKNNCIDWKSGKRYKFIEVDGKEKKISLTMFHFDPDCFTEDELIEFIRSQTTEGGYSLKDFITAGARAISSGQTDYLNKRFQESNAKVAKNIGGDKGREASKKKYNDYNKCFIGLYNQAIEKNLNKQGIMKFIENNIEDNLAEWNSYRPKNFEGYYTSNKPKK